MSGNRNELSSSRGGRPVAETAKALTLRLVHAQPSQREPSDGRGESETCVSRFSFRHTSLAQTTDKDWNDSRERK
jgi:hypothetical protein